MSTECLTKQLGLRIPIDELKQTKYPSGLKYPEFPPRKGKAKAIEDDEKAVEKIEKFRKAYKEKYKRRYKGKYGGKKQSAHKVQESSSEVESSESSDGGDVGSAKHIAQAKNNRSTELKRFDLSKISGELYSVTLDLHDNDILEFCLPISTPKLSKGTLHWTVDSGATIHCCNDKSILTSIYPDATANLTVANNQTMEIKTIGSATVHFTDTDGKTHPITIHNVCYHPQFSSNLLSVYRLWKDNNLKTVFEDKNYFKDLKTKQKFTFAHCGQYLMNTAYKAILDFNLLHSRFGHCSARRLKKLSSRCEHFPSHDLRSFFHDPNDCDACRAGGAKKKPFHKNTEKDYKYFGEKLSSDLCGPFPKSIFGFKYILCVVDASTNYLWVDIAMDPKISGVGADQLSIVIPIIREPTVHNQ